LFKNFISKKSFFAARRLPPPAKTLTTFNYLFHQIRGPSSRTATFFVTGHAGWSTAFTPSRRAKGKQAILRRLRRILEGKGGADLCVRVLPS
jgi:hypothetical protein